MAEKRKRKKSKLKYSGAPSLDSVFTSGGAAFTSGMAGVVPGGEIRRKKKLPVPPPWPAGEETLIEKDGEFYEV